MLAYGQKEENEGKNKRRKKWVEYGGVLKRDGDRKWTEDSRISLLPWYIKLPSVCNTSSHRSNDADRKK